MANTIKKNLRALKRSDPGERFQDAHEKARRKRKQTPLWLRILRFALAIVAFALGVVFVFIPGPAVVFFLLSGALLATESRPVAVVLDWTELRLQAIWRWLKKRWKALGTPARILLVATGAIVAVGMAALTVIYFLNR